MAKEIPLTKGKVTVVDDEDYERFGKFKWHCVGGRYAARSVGGRKKQENGIPAPRNYRSQRRRNSRPY